MARKRKKKGKRIRDEHARKLAGSRRAVHFAEGGTLEEWRPRQRKHGNKKAEASRKKCRGRTESE